MDGRLMATLQTDREGSIIIVRSPQVRDRPRSGDGTLLCAAQLPGAPEPVATNGLIGINSVAQHGVGATPLRRAASQIDRVNSLPGATA
jgi:hypothetical protein